MSYLDNIRTFVRVYELGSMSAAGRDLRISPAVTSARISQLEDHLNRNTEEEKLATEMIKQTINELVLDLNGDTSVSDLGEVVYSFNIIESELKDVAKLRQMKKTDHGLVVSAKTLYYNVFTNSLIPK